MAPELSILECKVDIANPSYSELMYGLSGGLFSGAELKTELSKWRERQARLTLDNTLQRGIYGTTQLGGALLEYGVENNLFSDSEVDELRKLALREAIGQNPILDIDALAFCMAKQLVTPRQYFQERECLEAFIRIYSALRSRGFL